MVPALRIDNVPRERPEATILRTLAYYDIFKYPLSEGEIRSSLAYYVDAKDFSSAMNHLLFKGHIFTHKGFYALHNNPELSKRRVNGNNRAKELLPKARRIGAFLNKFPYVRGVAVSGSLSKNYADARADIDFFIIAREDRLWIARTILHAFKKLAYLVGKQHYYCMNYFVDETALNIDDQNIYSATEVVTLLPVSGKHSMEQFFAINGWAKNWLPFYENKCAYVGDDNLSWFKKTMEGFLDNSFGARVDDFLYKWTSRRWARKEQMGRRNMKGNVMNLLTSKHCSRSNPGAFQEKVLMLYDTQIDELKARLPEYFSDHSFSTK